MMKMRCGALAFLAIAGFALASWRSASAQEISRLEITEYGIYTTDSSKTHRDADGVLQGTATNVRHAATTTTVPAELGVRFGVRFRVIGAPSGKMVAIRKVWIYPAGGVKSPQSRTPLRTNEATGTFAIGATAYTDYGFDDPWELVPGTWTLQLWSGDRKLAEQTFNVVAH